MLKEWLERPQRLIAFARIGLHPTPADIETAIRCLDKAQDAMRNNGQSAVALHPARAALVSLRWGHLPHRDACISAVANLGAVMALGEEVE